MFREYEAGLIYAHVKGFEVMKKSVLAFLGAVFMLVSCNRGTPDNRPSPAYYTDWDRAIRVDVDMQNMFVRSPRKIEKPIDMYMAMALALKYNYSRRMVSYEQSLMKAGENVSRLPEIMSNAGYVNTNSSSNLSPDLKVAWNILDISTVYYQTQDPSYAKSLSFEQSRKVIHNILQETRTLYWKTLEAQKLLPLIDGMIEYMTLQVDDMNVAANSPAKAKVPTAPPWSKRENIWKRSKACPCLNAIWKRPKFVSPA